MTRVSRKYIRKGIAHPMKAFLDVIEQFSRLIKKDASPDLQQMGRISLLLLFGYIRIDGSCHGLEENGNPGARDVGQGILLQVAGYQHQIGL